LRLRQTFLPNPFSETTAVVFENDRSGFEKRPQSFLETTALVFFLRRKKNFGKNGKDGCKLEKRLYLCSRIYVDRFGLLATTLKNAKNRKGGLGLFF